MAKLTRARSVAAVGLRKAFGTGDKGLRHVVGPSHANAGYLIRRLTHFDISFAPRHDLYGFAAVSLPLAEGSTVSRYTNHPCLAANGIIAIRLSTDVGESALRVQQQQD